MKLKVTPQNLSHIKALIEKLGKGKSLTDRMYYPTSKKCKTIIKQLGLSQRIIDKSNIDTFNTFSIEKDFMNGHHFLIVHNNKRDFHNSMSDFRAFLIDTGDIVEFKNGKVFVKTNHPTKRKEKAIRVFSFI